MTAPGDAERTVAHLFHRSGRASLSENELANAMSLDLKWFTPSAARSVVAALAREGYLRRNDDGELLPAFDTKPVPLPLGYRPPPDLADHIGSRPEAKPAATAPAPKPAPAPAARPVAQTPASPPFELGALLAALADRSGEDVGVWVQRLDAVIQRSEDAVVPEVALLLAAASEGVDVSSWLPAARVRLAAARPHAE